MKTVLIVDDSKFLRLAAERALIRAGFKVCTARDGEEALRMVSSHGLDLIVLDMLLPKLAGLEVLKSLRQNPVTALTPVIVLSSEAQKNEAKLLKEGATAYFEKSKLCLDKNSDAFLKIVRQMIGSSVLEKVQPETA